MAAYELRWSSVCRCTSNWWRTCRVPTPRYSGRIATAVALILAALTARMSESYDGIYVFMQTLMSISAGPTLAILVLGMFWRRCTQWGGFAGLLVGSTSALAMNLDSVSSALFSIEDPFLYISIWSFVLSALVAVGVSFFTRPWPAERIADLMWSSAQRGGPARDAAV